MAEIREHWFILESWLRVVVQQKCGSSQKWPLSVALNEASQLLRNCCEIFCYDSRSFNNKT